jgi:hypothetical protein
MDPYLESTVFWRDLHQSLIYCCRAALGTALPPEFAAQLDERLYVTAVQRSLYPDISVSRQPQENDGGGTAVLAAPQTEQVDMPLILRATRQQVREPFIEIVAVNTPGQVVTTIEILSPANKRPGAGREEYLRKQSDLLPSDIHLLEIDLLRGGLYTIAAPEEDLRGEHGRWDYVVSLHRAGRPDEYEVWPRLMRERLPRVLVPLTGGYEDVPLDLQAVLDRAYDEGMFARRVAYTADPETPFSAEDTVWADTLLRQKGLRP